MWDRKYVDSGGGPTMFWNVNEKNANSELEKND